MVLGVTSDLLSSVQDPSDEGLGLQGLGVRKTSGFGVVCS